MVWDADPQRYHVLDFTLQRRDDGRRFAAELKCEIEFEGYRYLSLRPGRKSAIIWEEPHFRSS